MVGEIRMSLIHESIFKPIGYNIGDMKMVTYNITFTAHQQVEPETGWFLLNGVVVAQTTYPILFARFGTTFNTGGEGTGNFRLPDMTDGVVPIPKGLTNFTSFGVAGGEINHTLSTAELASHPHSDTFSAVASAHGHSGSGTIDANSYSHAHVNTGVTFSLGAGGGGGASGDQPNSDSSPTSNANTHSHSASVAINSATSPNLTVGGSVNSAGGGGSHNNMQPYLVMGGWLVRHG